MSDTPRTDAATWSITDPEDMKPDLLVVDATECAAIELDLARTRQAAERLAEASKKLLKMAMDQEIQSSYPGNLLPEMDNAMCALANWEEVKGA